MFMKSPKYRVFDYPARFYKPEEDQEEKRKKKLNFREGRKFKKKRKSALYWVIIFALILYLYFKIQGM